MKDIIKKISETWLDYRKHCIDESTSGYEVKVVKQDHPTYLLIIGVMLLSPLIRANLELRRVGVKRRALKSIIKDYK